MGVSARGLDRWGLIGDRRLESVLSWKGKGTCLLREVEAFQLGFLVGVGIWTSDLKESLGS